MHKKNISFFLRTHTHTCWLCWSPWLCVMFSVCEPWLMTQWWFSFTLKDSTSSWQTTHSTNPAVTNTKKTSDCDDDDVHIIHWRHFYITENTSDVCVCLNHLWLWMSLPVNTQTKLGLNSSQEYLVTVLHKTAPNSSHTLYPDNTHTSVRSDLENICWTSFYIRSINILQTSVTPDSRHLRWVNYVLPMYTQTSIDVCQVCVTCVWRIFMFTLQQVEDCGIDGRQQDRRTRFNNCSLQ